MGAVANARIQDKSIIFTSRNHKAIDAVVDRLKDDNGAPLIVRANSKDDPNLNYTFKKAIIDLRSDSIDLDSVKKYEREKDYLTKRLVKRGAHASELDKIWKLRDNIGDLEEKISWLKEDLDKKIIDKLINGYPQVDQTAITKFQQLTNVLNKYTDNKNQTNWLNYLIDWLFILPKWLSAKSILRNLSLDIVLSALPPLKKENLSSINIKLLIDIKNFIDF